MKRTLFAILLILLSTSSFGQKIRFTDSTNVWRFWNWSSAITIAPVPYTDDYTGDTIILGKAYKKLHHDFLSSVYPFFVYVREDVIANKVYAIAEIYPDYDTSEHLLYDYNLHIGDTFKSKHSVHFVSSIDSVFINSVWHKVWYFFPSSHDSIIYHFGLYPNDYFVIEGIGCINNPCFPHSPYTFETRTDLSCFNNRGIPPPLSHTVGPYFNNTTSCSLTFGLGINTSQNHKTIIAPNPINQTTKILFPHQITSGTVTIINSMGQLVSKIPFENKEDVTIGAKVIVPGIYYYRVTDNISGESFTGKFVCQ